ncbi:cysteine-binding protein FliY [Aspergillus fumigatus Z5]|nr:cysteine-binding protein FliY [Aspergillus fumigatus Z5]
MVGVPHSTGCSLCRERRIKVGDSSPTSRFNPTERNKCDEAVPQCSQCRKYGRPCPGYRRTFRFQDEGPALQRRHQSRSQSRRRPETATDAATAAAAAVVRNNAIAMMRQTRSEDPCSSSAAAAAAAAQSQTHLHQMQLQMQMQLQQPHLFASFLHSAFPTLYTSNIFRAHNRPDFLAHVASSYASGAAPYLAATLACLTSIYTAQFSPDPAQHTRRSRQLYAHALTHVVAALHSPAALSAPLLATIMMLAVYEMYARTSPDAFVVHVDGVRRIMLARGPGLHFPDDKDKDTDTDNNNNNNHPPASAIADAADADADADADASGEGPGFARGCYIAFRGFLVATALYEGRACFLDEEDWLRFAGRIRAEDVRKAGRDARVVDVCERIWMEVVRCPRYFAEALPEGRPGTVPEGVDAGLDEGLDEGVGGEGAGDAEPAGAEDMVAALESLLVWLRGGSGRRRRGGGGGFRVVSDFQRGVSSASSEALPVTWLDRVASSMGVIGLKVIWEDSIS